MHHGTILECSDEDFDFSFDLNVKSMHRTIKAFLPAMLEGGGGSIVNISSCAALRPPANRYVYSASKAAVSLLTRAVALDFITQGIRCNAICPGTVETPSMLERAAAAGPDGREKFVARQKMGRLGTADEIAAMAVYLASDEAAFTTGVDMVVDGGFTALMGSQRAFNMNKIDLNGLRRPSSPAAPRVRPRHCRAFCRLRRRGRDLGFRPAAGREDRARRSART